ncbi:STAS/SEC14 domain-containing protein [Myxococcus sp. RHSTA-1-4]|uniref:STAS/SEC14 domain-containing protein n=1 Tax=Myxococcus sp. RHSTA-1-4 TaxID=2874601 RepID=UPI001CC16867|nr:STAS/SEC14 domain-containing protein [Myxococcus sp. RHSTA-1-4]MBZ4415646.1 STAS/SEC14 domain-containing protein [Myxococcus sp. RHSTA-1-4]
MGAMWTMGLSKLWFEEPDTVRLVTVGAFDMKLMTEVNAVAEELRVHHPAIYLVSDMRQSSGLTPEVRKAIGESPDANPFAGMVIFGASFAVRTMANMMTRAAALLGRQGTKPFAMVDTEEEAKAWVAAQRDAARVKQAS